MDTASESQCQERDDSAADAPEPRNAGSRRRLLGGAASGLTLAASGLLLPEWLVEEAAADRHPVRRIQGRKERRREKRRDEHGQHRDKKDKQKDQGKPRGRDLDFKDIQFYVANFATQPLKALKVAFWAGAEKRTNGDSGPWRLVYELRGDPKNLWPFGTAGNQDTLWTYFTGGVHENDCALWIEDRFLVHVENPVVGFVQLKMGYGGTFDKNGWHGGTTVYDESIFELAQAKIMKQAGYTFAVSRDPDTDDYKRIAVTIGN